MLTDNPNYLRGLFVAVLGPDGSGKSTLVDSVLDRIGSSYRKTWHFHWRPNLLPKLLSLKGTSMTAPPGPPPEKAAYGKTVSLLRYVYYLLDFILGYWVVIYPRKMRNTLVIGERWYYDVIVHPARYGFALPQWLLRLGGYLVPRPDLTLLLEADPDVIYGRKPELSVQQIRAQLDCFHDLLGSVPKGRCIWTGGTLEESIQAFANVVLTASTRPIADRLTASKLALNWNGFPSANNPKVWVNRADSLSNALNLYHPYSWKGRLARSIARYLPRALVAYGAPIGADQQRLRNLSNVIFELFNDKNLTISFSTGTPGPHRKLTAQVSREGRVIAYVKIAREGKALALLEREATALHHIASSKHEWGTTPRVITYQLYGSEQLLFLSAPDQSGNIRQLNPDVKDALFLESFIPRKMNFISVGDAFKQLQQHASLNLAEVNDIQTRDILIQAQETVEKLLTKTGVRVGVCHGDFTPWNTLGLFDGSLYVFDWEYGCQSAPLLLDLFHRVFMPEWLVRKRSANWVARRLLNLSMDPVLGNVIRKSGIAPEELPAYVLLYLANQALLKLYSDGNIPVYLEECMHYVLVNVGHPAHRRRVLVSAYACEPDKGSEQGVGWHWVDQISRNNDVWIITRKNNRKALEQELMARPNPHIHLAYTDLPYWLAFWKRGQRGVRTYYYLWQFAALIKAWNLHCEIKFDLGHHVTFVNDWLWSFLALMPIPYVWGPIGSHPPCPNVLLPHWRAVILEAVRLLIQRAARMADPLYWLTVARASVVIPINRDVARQFHLRWLAKGRCIVETAIGMDALPVMDLGNRQSRQSCTILYVGRFHYVKCPYMVIEAFSSLAKIKPDATLIMLGVGPEEDNMRRIVDKLGLKKQVRFLGWRKREEVLDFMKEATVFLFPSAEGAGMVVLEAMGCGLPVVCLDLGGPKEMVDTGCGFRVPAEGTFQEMVEGLGRALVTLCNEPELRAYMSEQARRLVQLKYTWERKQEVLSIAYDQACGSRNLKRSWFLDPAL